MTFPEKSAICMSVILTIVFGTYLLFIGWWFTQAPIDEIPWQPLMVLTVVPLAVLAAVSHIALALWSPKAANAHDERDHLVTMRSEQIGGYLLAVGVFAGLSLAIADLDSFYIAHTLLLAWVVAEIADGVTKTVLYRRGV